MATANTIYNTNKIPKSFIGEWRSVEFECIFKSTDTIEEFVKFAREKKYDRYICIKEDGSVYPNRGDYDGEEHEVVVSFRSGDEKMEAMLLDICIMLKRTAYVNKSCGTHVHFDMRQATPEEAKLYATRLARCVPALKTILPKSRHSSSFCRLDINDFDKYDRYAFVNLHAYRKFKTIEVRGHSGTLSASKILNWSRLCELIMHTPVELKNKIYTIDALKKEYALDNRLVRYIDRRINKFTQEKVQADVEPAPQHAG